MNVLSKPWIGVLAVAIALGLGGPGVQAAPNVLEQVNEALVSSVEKVLPAVVNISSERDQEVAINNPFEGTPFEDLFRFPRGRARAVSLGSGVVVDGRQGHILTNNHVVEGADRIYIEYHGPDGLRETFEGQAFTDPKTELALVKIKDMRGIVLPEAQLADSDSLRVGHLVMAIGSPFGKHQSVSMGIVSGLGRLEHGPEFRRTMYQDFIQTDAAINRGNSGGPLVNIYGEVVGINTFILSTSAGAQGVGFAIPINLAKPVIEQLAVSGRVVRPFLGVFMTNVRDLGKQEIEALGMEDPRGVIVQRLVEDSPAEKGGIQPFDILLEFDGEPIESSTGLQRQVLARDIGESVPIRLWRPSENKAMTVAVVLEEQPDTTPEIASAAAPSSVERLGMQLQPLTKELAEQHELGEAKGLFVVEVKEGSGAEREGLQPGDVILKANWEEVPTVADLDRVIEGLRKEEKGKIVLVVARRSMQVLIFLDLKEE